MARTEEQKAADEALTAALEECHRVYFGADQGVIMTDYLAVVAHQGIVGDGTSKTVISTLVRDGDIPNYRVLGLIEYAHSAMRNGVGRLM